jgi:uncharacterized RDD family membrane protein YckC
MTNELPMNDGNPVPPRQPRAIESVVGTDSAADTETPASEPIVGSNVGSNPAPTADSWRVEVAARLERYRNRRKPRTPRYPSLLLPFDAPESWSGSPQINTAPAATAMVRLEQDFEFQRDADEGSTSVAPAGIAEPRPPAHSPTSPSADLSSSNVIEFPRSAAIPVSHSSTLADPIFDRPRIVEAPEILPPPPALGGMLMDPAPKESAEHVPPTKSPSASIGRRALAAFVDGAVLTAALAAFGAIFLRFNTGLNPTLASVRESLLPLAGGLGAVAVLLWAAYKFLFVVYTGSTLGLRAARLQLASFDGSPLTRRSRRWRVLASFLSAFSAGLGYVWCLLDQDGLCWHDRITRTHIRSL